MKRYFLFVVCAIILAACTTETPDPGGGATGTSHTLSGMYAYDDGSGLSDKFVEFDGKELTLYIIKTAQAFVEGYYWHCNKSDFTVKGKEEYTYHDTHLNVGTLFIFEAVFKEGYLYLDQDKYSKLDGFKEESYSSIILDKTSLDMTIGQQEMLTATIVHTDAMEWSSSNSEVVTVNQNGLVNAVGIGTATITVKSGDTSASCEVKVKAIPTFSINPESLMMTGLGQTKTITITSDSDCIFTAQSSDPSIAGASVSDKTVTITANAYGTATITVDCPETDKYTFAESLTCEVLIIQAEDLSASGTANCYIVNKAGDFKFNCTVKGHSTVSVGTVACAEVLWESFGTDVAPNVGDIVSNVTYTDGYVQFSTPSILKNGNAVIAVKNASGNILWSWHIWVCDGFDPNATAQVYNNSAGTMMDRNLGATSAAKGDVHALGLLYQWGRKEPFLGSSSISSNTKAATTLSWPEAVSSNASNGTIAYAVANPTTFIKYNSSNYDWYYTGDGSTDNTRWNSNKGVYDPCPAGWRVPDGGSTGVWSKAFGTSSKWTALSNWDSTNIGMDFGSTYNKLGSGTIWYPAAGYLRSDVGSLTNVGYDGSYWSCSPNSSYYAYYLYFDDSGNVYPSYDIYRADGQSVRCLKEGSNEPESEKVYANLSEEGTANCYIVSEEGDYKFDCSVKSNSTESVGTVASAEVLWESFGTDVKPNVGDIVNNVTYADGYVQFSTPSILKNGNAVIAVKNASGNILWSWHIWVCDGFDPNATAQVYNNSAGTMMDRNLGATSATPGDVHALGLLYQWGRKDPFMGGCHISYSTPEDQTNAVSTITWPSAVASNASKGTIAYAVAHPTTFILCNSSNDDWYYTGDSSTDDTRWNSSKGVYDPCPAGWRVPDGGSTGVWSKAFGTSYSWTTASNWDSTNKGMDFGSTDKKLGSGTIWYPAAGYLRYYDGSLNYVGYDGTYWSCSPSSSRAYFLYFNYNCVINPSNSYLCASGLSVRCLRE